MRRARTTFAAAAMFSTILLGTGGHATAAPPFVTEDAGTQGKGNVEADFTFDYRKADDGTKTQTLGNTFMLGVARKVDLIIGYTYDFVDVPGGEDTRGMGDLAVQLKTPFNEGKGWLPTFAFRGGVSLPVEEGGQTAILATGIAQWAFDPFIVFANVGADIGTRLAGNDERTDTLRASVAGAWEVREELFLVSEILWEKQTKPSQNATAEWMLGTQWELNDAMFLSAGLRIGLTGDAPDYTVLAGFVWLFQGEKGEAPAGASGDGK